MLEFNFNDGAPKGNPGIGQFITAIGDAGKPDRWKLLTMQRIKHCVSQGAGFHPAIGQTIDLPVAGGDQSCTVGKNRRKRC